MVVQRHRQMISYQVLSRDTQIHGVPELKLSSKLCELLLGHVWTLFRIIWFAKEDVVESSNSHG